jgi:hypothetical protein
MGRYKKTAVRADWVRLHAISVEKSLKATLDRIAEENRIPMALLARILLLDAVDRIESIDLTKVLTRK